MSGGLGTPALSRRNGAASLGCYFFVPNPLDRYTLSERNDLKVNADGSIDLYLQKDNPGPDKESNWLPVPPSGSIPMFRLYWPKETPPSVLDGSW